MSAQPSVLQVVILRDGLLVGTEVFVPGVYTLGSSAGVDLRLDDTQVAPQQATLYFQNGKAAIQDTGGGRGVYVNGHRIRACEVRSVDEVACGPFVLKARVLQQRQQQMALPPEVANLLRATPAGGASAAVARSAAALQSAANAVPLPAAGPAPLRPVAGTAPSARRLAGQPGAAARPLPGSDDRSSRVVEEFFQEEHPTFRATAAVAHVPSDPGTGPFVAARALSADGSVVNQQAVRPPISYQPTVPGAAATPAGHPRPELLRPAVEPPTVGIDLTADPDAWQLEAPPEPIRDANGIPTGSVANFQWPSAPPEMEESQPAFMLDEPLELAPRAAPPVPPVPPVSAGAAQRRPAAAPVSAAPAARAVRSAQKLPPPKKGGPRLYFELYWGNQRHKAWSFVPTVKKPVKAGPREDVDLPLYGLGVEQAFVIGEQADADAFKVFVPPGVKIERGESRTSLAPVAPTSLEQDETRRYVTLKNGQALRLSAGNTALTAWVAPPPAKEKVSLFKQLPILLLLCLIAMGSTAITFLYKAQGLTGETGFTPKDMPNVAVRLIAPTPKKKERVKKNLAELRERAQKRDTQKKPKAAGTPKPKQPQKTASAATQSKALQAVQKITAGAATGDILSAVNKQGGGSKKTKGYALTGLIGKGVAAPGSGGLGSGGLGKGKGTLGGELLRGKGGTGIGAIGAGGVGKGVVGGTVARASGRAVQSSGDIDRNAVAKVVNDHMSEVQACYERALLRTPSLSGKVVIEWTIGGVGKVVSVRTKNSTLRSSAVEGCIMNALKKWQFPRPRGGSVIITYPFLFNSVGF